MICSWVFYTWIFLDSCNPYTALNKSLIVLYLLAAKKLQQDLSRLLRAAPGPSRFIMEAALGRRISVEVGRSVYRWAQAVVNTTDYSRWSGQGTEVSLYLRLNHRRSSPSPVSAPVPKRDQSRSPRAVSIPNRLPFFLVFPHPPRP